MEAVRKSSDASTPSLARFSRNKEELQSLVDLFLRQSEEVQGILQRNCLDGKNKDWVEAAHKLKGGAAVAQAQNLTDLCERAQQMEVATAQERRLILDEIQAEYQKVKDSLLATL